MHGSDKPRSRLELPVTPSHDEKTELERAFIHTETIALKEKLAISGLGDDHITPELLEELVPIRMRSLRKDVHNGGCHQRPSSQTQLSRHRLPMSKFSRARSASDPPRIPPPFLRSMPLSVSAANPDGQSQLSIYPGSNTTRETTETIKCTERSDAHAPRSSHASAKPGLAQGMCGNLQAGAIGTRTPQQSPHVSPAVDPVNAPKCAIYYTAVDLDPLASTAADQHHSMNLTEHHGDDTVGGDSRVFVIICIASLSLWFDFPVDAAYVYVDRPAWNAFRLLSTGGEGFYTGPVDPGIYGGGGRGRPT
ncbi:hypothetical protein PLICRDRAFT_175662 [Plicaturopsis crispa FD-325 SS-3]|nr:hypothetical protein PLICRDRAFT_175662 [Plicaturopsis crispa FD-325 SS-3]